MTGSWQEIVVTTAAIVAFVWLVTDRIRRRSEKSKCDSCALAQTLRRDD